MRANGFIHYGNCLQYHLETLGVQMTQKKRTWNLSEMNRPNLIQLIQELDCKQDWQIIIQKSKDSRTIEQNRRLWDLYRNIGNFLGYTADELHLLMGYKFLRQHEYVGNTMVEYIESTTKLDTKQMSQYQESIEIWASQMGWSWDE